MESSDGFLELVKGYLGNDTDEFNQVIHSLYSSCQSIDRKDQLLIEQLQPREDLSAVLCASGPSLDNHLEQLKDNQDMLIILASGSSVGSLLRAGVKPYGVILLEMSSIVYQDLLDLISEGYKLSSIVAFVSSTVDPRIAALFSRCVVFHRPLSSAFCLYPNEESSSLPQAGPQAANAGIEVALSLGIRNFLLLGCDFGTSNKNLQRSEGAIGISPRDFDLPVKGAFGRTIFSNAELSSTRQLFENSLRLYSAEATALGEGSFIEGVNHESKSLSDVVDRYYSDQSKLSLIISSLQERSVSKSNLASIIDQALAFNDNFSKKLIDELSASDGFTSNIHDLLNSILSWKDDHLHHGERLYSRMTRFLYFFVCQCLLFDSIDDSFDWSYKVNAVCSSLRQINELYKAYFLFLLDIEKMKVYPDWDSAWLKKRMAKQMYALYSQIST